MSSGFVSEAELEEKRKIRQEEWEKVRRADEPKEAPEEPFDHRSLFDRLEEQKQKKQMEYEEAHKLKNMIRGLDDDEVDFLDFVDQKKIEAEQLKELQEKKELQEFRMHVEKLKENFLDERIQAEIRTTTNKAASSTHSFKSQQKLLQGVVIKRKASANNEQDLNEKRSRSEADREGECSYVEGEAKAPSPSSAAKRKQEAEETPSPSPTVTCIGILPGLGNYSPSSDSNSSSSFDEPDHVRPMFDLLGRRLVYEAKEDKGNQHAH